MTTARSAAGLGVAGTLSAGAGRSAAPDLPPRYRLHIVAADQDALACAAARAAEGAEEGTAVFADRADRLDAAVVLHLDRPADYELEAVYLAAVALCDALGAQVPPQLPIAVAWPNGILANGATLGHLRVALSRPGGSSGTGHAAGDGIDGINDPWLAIGLTLQVHGLDQDPGHAPDRTSLYDEAATEPTAIGLFESFSRHLLSWIDACRDGGYDPARRDWARRAMKAGSPALALDLPGGRRVAGTLSGLDETGAAIVQTAEGVRLVSLGDGLRAVGATL